MPCTTSEHQATKNQKKTGNKDSSIYPSMELLVLVMTQMTYEKVKPTYVKKVEK